MENRGFLRQTWRVLGGLHCSICQQLSAWYLRVTGLLQSKVNIWGSVSLCVYMGCCRLML